MFLGALLGGATLSETVKRPLILLLGCDPWMQKEAVKEQQPWMKNWKTLEYLLSQKDLEGLGRGPNQIVDGGTVDKMGLNV